MTLTSFSRSHRHCECQILTKKLVLYCIIRIFLKEMIIFWRPWPNFQGHHTKKTVKMSLVYTLISWTNWWILTKLAQKHHWDMGKIWSDFGNRDIIFKVKPALWMPHFDQKKLVCTLSPEPIGALAGNSCHQKTQFSFFPFISLWKFKVSIATKVLKQRQ